MLAFKYVGLLAACIGAALVGNAHSQSIPCYSAAQCAQVRIEAQQRQSTRDAANEAQRRAYAQSLREAARAAAEEARDQAAERARQAVLDQAAADDAQRSAAFYRA